MSPYEYMDSVKRFSEEKLPNKEWFYSSVKDGTTNDNGKLNGHISDEDYLTCNKIWNEFNMKNMGHYDNHYLKKKCFVIVRCIWNVYWFVVKILQTRSLSLF